MADDETRLREEVTFPADVEVPDEIEERLRGQADDDDDAEELED